MMIKFAITTMFLFASLTSLSVARAQTVNTWVDEEGVTHYSDQKPAADGAEVEEIEVPEAGVSEFESEDVTERINKQLQQLEQDRKAREQAAEERKKARALEEALEREPLIVEEKKKKKDKDRDYRGPYPKPPPGPFPEQYPRQRGPTLPSPVNPANQGNQ